MDLSSVPWLEVLRFALLSAAAGFGFLSWRWYQIDSRREREELMRSRYVMTEMMYIRPTKASVDSPHHEYKIFQVRVTEDGGFRNFLKKIFRKEFTGSTDIMVSGIWDMGRDKHHGLVRGSTMSYDIVQPRRKELGLPDNLEEIVDDERFSAIGLTEDDIEFNTSKFRITLPTANPEAVDDSLARFFDIIDDVCYEDYSS